MQVWIAGTHLNGDRLTVVGELAIRRIEPVVSLRGRLLVVKSKHYKLHIHLIVATLCFQAMFATL